ncbi:MAG TPA: M10 family metallopeptidase [Allosphingosinicella sp.]
MAAVQGNVRSGDRDVDAMLEGFRWSASMLTFSFPTSAGQYGGAYGPGDEPYDNFQAFSSSQQLRAREVLASFSSVAMLDYDEVSGGGGDLRFGMTDDTAAAHAYTPGPDARAGDTWYGNSSGWYDDPRVGNYGYHALLHEVGHAVGLKHPHETHQFGAVSGAHDWMAYSVMSYRSYEGQSLDGGFSNEENGYSQSLMMYDIAALQHMYGARFDTVPVDTVYHWTPGSSQMLINGVGQPGSVTNRIFRTVWDGGGNDTYDLSAYTTGMRISLEPGKWSELSAAQLPSLSGMIHPPGNVANALLHRGDTRSLIENAIGGSGNDEITGNAGANRLDGGAGADRLSGGFGDDVYIVDDLRDEIVSEATVARGGTDTVESSVHFTLGTGVEKLVLTGAAATRGEGNSLDNVITGNGAANYLKSGLGADLLVGGGGNDRYFIHDADDRVLEVAGGGVDHVLSQVDFRLSEGVETLELSGPARAGTGNAGANRIVGTAAANRLDGGAGIDVLIGGGADDLYVFDHARDRAVERADGGFDTVLSSVGHILRAEVEALALVGRAALAGTGNALANSLTGNHGANRLDGAEGDDRLVGGRGNDLLTGGEGRDAFCFDSALNRFNNVDELIDYSRIDDTIYLDCDVFTALAEGKIAAEAFHRGAAAADAGDRILFDQASGKLFYDADGNGDGAAILFATLAPGASVNSFDFVGYI